jgi:surface antigen
MNNIRSLLAVLIALLVASSALAEPPPWAPAHGWRKKNDPDYVGYTGKRWERDYGVLDGRCNTAAVGAVLGGVTGAVIGSRASDAEDRPVAIILGSAIGAVIGAKIGEEIDAADRACMGHALELAGERKTVVWTNSSRGVTYRLTPTRNVGTRERPCREFKTVVSSGKKRDLINGVACRRGNGDWVLRT